MKTWEAISNALTLLDVITLIISGVIALAGLVALLLFVFRKQRRLMKNLQKPLLFLNLTKDPDGMNVEANILKKSGFFTGPELSSDPRSVDLIDTHSLVVLGVNDDTDIDRFKQAYEKIRMLEKPVIVYTLGNRETSFLKDNNAYIRGYSYHSFCTTPLRLTSDVFTILSTFPE